MKIITHRLKFWRTVQIANTILPLAAITLELYAESWIGAVVWIPALLITMFYWKKELEYRRIERRFEFEIKVMQEAREDRCAYCGHRVNVGVFIDSGGFGHIRIECVEGCSLPEIVTAEPVAPDERGLYES